MDEGLVLAGLMSGTSCDGIDCALLRYAPGARPELLAYRETPMPEALREPILRLCAPGVDEIELMGEVHVALGEAYAEAVRALEEEAGVRADVIGMHGQTIRHRPRARWPFTWQIGSAAVVAERTGRTVVYDFRSRDIAAGGEGAPLAPLMHRVLFGERDADVAVVNVGGIANITWLGKDGRTFGFDAGPGNLVMDRLVNVLTDGRERMDRDGMLAAMGRASEAHVQDALRHPFFARRPPKSADRGDFEPMAEALLRAPDLADADRVATALEITARAIADAQRFLPRAPARWIVCGGGARNPALMRRLQALVQGEVCTSKDLGFPPEAIEACAFAVFALHALVRLPTSLAAATGARADASGGAIVPGDNWKALIARILPWIR
ncbi:MAG: anhydro-N-acetylmuramic acid kinase [Zetaproteobacteria bacterium]|nr:MAG: anhydro-N-acetylmuramic acid kinase [Zetaproteobacteria bacterium]